MYYGEVRLDAGEPRTGIPDFVWVSREDFPERVTFALACEG